MSPHAPDFNDLTDRAADAIAPARGSSSPVDLIGQTIADSYLIEQRLGSGGMGVVYRARHLRLGYHVALKCIHPGSIPDVSTMRRLLQEARAAAQIRHDNVVQILDGGQLEGGLPYIVMEYLEGESLSALVERTGPLPWRRVANIIAQIAAALAAAHSVGIVHRDIKPANCLRLNCGIDLDIIKVLDFGLAKLAPQLRGQSESLTSTGAIMGTPGYIAPEVYRGFGADARSDLYALGVLTYKLLEGELPPFRIPDTALSQAPASFRVVILRCLSQDPEDRYPSAEHVYSLLLDLLRIATDGPTVSADRSPQTYSSTHADTATVPRLGTEITRRTTARSWRYLVWFGLAVASAGIWAAFILMKQPTNIPASEAIVPAAPRSPTGSLYLNTTPSEAIVAIDGVEVPGTSWPRTIGGLSAGPQDANHRVRISSDTFYLPHEQVVTITAGHTFSLPVALDARDVTVNVYTSPSNATVKLVEGDAMPTVVARDGEAFKIRRLPGVPYKLIVERTGHDPVERPINFSGDHVERINIIFGPGPPESVPTVPEVPPVLDLPKTAPKPRAKAKDAELKIGSGPSLPPAIIWVDGVRQRKPSPLTVQVTSGTHTVKWKYPNGDFTVKVVKIAEGNSMVIKGTL